MRIDPGIFLKLSMWNQMGEGQMMMRSFVEEEILNGRLGLGSRPLVRVTDENRHRRLPSPIVLVLVLVLQNSIERRSVLKFKLCIQTSI